MKAISFLSAVSSEDGSLPTEFRIFAFGANRAQKMGGDEMAFTLDQDSAAKVMAAFKDRGLDRLPIDLDHQIIDGGSTDTAGKAYGWFQPEVRSDGLYASNIKWTPEGADLLKGKAYRFFSPVFFTDDSDRIVDLINVALTNLPALKDIPALVAANAKPEHKALKMKLVLNALGVAEDADEAVALSAVEQLKDVNAQILALSGKATVAEALGALTAMKQSAEKVEQLTAENAQLKAEKQQAEINALVDEAVVDGRVAPAKREELLQLTAKIGVEGLKVCLSMLPKQPGQSTPVVTPATNPAAAPQLTAEEAAIARAAGIKPEQFAARKTSVAANGFSLSK